MMPVARLTLTDFKATLPRGAREKTLVKALEAGEVMKKWSATGWAQKIKSRATRKA